MYIFASATFASYLFMWEVTPALQQQNCACTGVNMHTSDTETEGKRHCVRSHCSSKLFML